MGKTKHKHGGKRKGAGRPLVHAEGPTAKLVAYVPCSLLEKLQAIADRRGWSRSETVTEAIRRL